MNFKRIQVIFLIAFAALNLVLFSTFSWTSHYKGSTSNQGQTSQTLKEMKNDLISYHPHSQGRLNGYYLSAKSKQLTGHASSLRNVSVHSEGNLINVDFYRPVELKTADSLDKLVQDHHQVIDGQKYSYNAALSTKHLSVYTQMIKGRPFLGREGQLRFRINDDNEVTGYTQGELSQIELLRPRSQSVIETQAVSWLYKHNQLPNNSKVKQPVYGYFELTERRGEKVLIPTWQVEVKTKNSGEIHIMHVNGMTGTMIKKKENS